MATAYSLNFCECVVMSGFGSSLDIRLVCYIIPHSIVVSPHDDSSKGSTARQEGGAGNDSCIAMNRDSVSQLIERGCSLHTYLWDLDEL